MLKIHIRKDPFLELFEVGGKNEIWTGTIHILTGKKEKSIFVQEKAQERKSIGPFSMGKEDAPTQRKSQKKTSSQKKVPLCK